MRAELSLGLQPAGLIRGWGPQLGVKETGGFSLRCELGGWAGILICISLCASVLAWSIIYRSPRQGMFRSLRKRRGDFLCLEAGVNDEVCVAWLERNRFDPVGDDQGLHQGFSILFLIDLYWSIVDLRWCGSFCYTAKWIRHAHPCTHSQFRFFSLVGHSAYWAELPVLSSRPCWLSTTYIVVCVCRSPRLPSCPSLRPTPTTTRSFLCLWLYFCSIDKFICIFF